MSKKIIDNLSGADLRTSMPNSIRPKNVFEEEDEVESEETITDRINRNLLRYKEIKMVYKKIGIPPAYLLYVLVGCLVLIVVGYLQNYLSLIIATAYPIYISAKTLQNKDSTKDDVLQWLTYW